MVHAPQKFSKARRQPKKVQDTWGTYLRHLFKWGGAALFFFFFFSVCFYCVLCFPGVLFPPPCVLVVMGFRGYEISLRYACQGCLKLISKETHSQYYVTNFYVLNFLLKTTVTAFYCGPEVHKLRSTTRVLKGCKTLYGIRLIDWLIHAITPASWNWLQFKIYLLDRGSVGRIHCPVKMAAGHLPTSSHNFPWRGVINHDRTTKLTLQTKYYHTMPAGYPKVAYPLEISFWTRNLFTRGQTLPDCFAIDSEAIDRRVDVVYRDVITGSRESRDHHYHARLIHRILKSLLPQNNTFFIATASVVKDAADNPDCQGLREQWYYLRFYVRRTMPPTVDTNPVYGVATICHQVLWLRHRRPYVVLWLR